MQNVLKLFAETSVTTIPAATIEVGKKGFISAMLLELNLDTAVGGYARMEVSLAPTAGFLNNGAGAAIGGLETVSSLATAAGLNNNTRQTVLSGLEIPVTPGEKLYLHIAPSSPGVGMIRGRAWLYVRTA
jgi:hypothetical protein